MPLSEHEQRLLDEMERNLYQNDADFVAAVSSRRGSTNYRALVLGILLGIVGLAVLVAGVVFRQPLLGVAGFGLMLGGVVLAMRPTAGSGGASAAPGAPSSGARRPSGTGQNGARFMDRLNERWDNRGDGRG